MIFTMMEEVIEQIKKIPASISLPGSNWGNGREKPKIKTKLKQIFHFTIKSSAAVKAVALAVIQEAISESKCYNP